jgi:hypothetical protein
MEIKTPARGPIEGVRRILRELLRTPRFKESVRIILRELDPENAALLVRTLMWEDPEFTLSLLGAAPAFLNAAIVGAGELVSQSSTFSPGVLTGFIAGVIGQLDGRAMGRAAGQALALSASLSAMRDEAVDAASARFWQEVGAGITESLPAGTEAGEGASRLMLDTLMPMLGSAVSRLGAQAVRDGSEARRLVKGLAEGMRAVASENPEFMREVVIPLVEAGREALAQAEAEAASEAEGEV